MTIPLESIRTGKVRLDEYAREGRRLYRLWSAGTYNGNTVR
jgi:hypothetical protein